jgi:hypothetical protein
MEKKCAKIEVMNCPMPLTAYISDSVHFKYFEMYVQNANNSFFLNEHLMRYCISDIYFAYLEHVG